VVDGAGRCVGVLADRAVAAAWAHDPGALARVPVAAGLDPDPAVVDSDARVGDAARLMRTAGVDAVVVVDPAGLPVGIVTGSDLIALLAR
jgi:CBS domain-containing protein